MTSVALEQKVSFAEAKNHFSALTTQANATGMPFIITKNHKPWVEVKPLAIMPQPKDGITIKPIRREVAIPDLDVLFQDFDPHGFVPREDGFAPAAGCEAM